MWQCCEVLSLTILTLKDLRDTPPTASVLTSIRDGLWIAFTSAVLVMMVVAQDV